MADDAEYAEGSTLELPNTEEIVALCHQNGFKSNGLTYPPNGSPIAYIKYGGMVSEGEIQTQNYVHKAFDKMSTASIVKVPKIYRAFEFEGQMYVVMEYIPGRTAGSLLRDSATDKNWIYDQVAKAFAHLLLVPVPQNSRPGPVGGGCI
jgi:serine/threonine protein kinase